MSSAVQNMNTSMTDKELLDTLSCNTGVWCKTMFPKRFRRPFSEGHKRAFRDIDNPYLKKLLVICHRNWGKSSIMQLGVPSKAICLQERNIIIPCSASATLAEEKSERLKIELETNPTLVKMFGNLKGDRWSREEWVTTTGQRVLPRGAGQQVRGIGDDFRPDLLLPDDLETKEGTESEQQRAKLKEWFFSDFQGLVDLADDSDWRIIFLGTPLHEASLLVDLAEDPEWTVVKCPLFNEDMETNWPEYMSTESIRRMADSYRSQGKIDSFYREWGLQIISTEDACFKTSFFKYYEESAEQLNRRPDVERMILIDPAKSVSPTADDSAIVGVAFSPTQNTVYVRDIVSGKFHQNEMWDHAFAMAKRINATAIGIEVTTLNEWIVWPLKNELLRRGSNLELVELKARGKKEDRIRGLIPLYRLGLVRHNKGVTHKLEQQLLSFGAAKHDDIMDALAYVVSMLSQGDRYMVMPLNDDKIEIYSDDGFQKGYNIEDEYKDLENEDALETDEWMLV